MQVEIPGSGIHKTSDKSPRNSASSAVDGLTAEYVEKRGEGIPSEFDPNSGTLLTICAWFRNRNLRAKLQEVFGDLNGTTLFSPRYLVSKRNDGQGGYSPGPNTWREEKELQSAEFKKIEGAFRQLGFWDIPTNSDYLGIDGSRWILEAAERGRYHVVDRWCANDNELEKKEFVRFCEFLTDLAGFEPQVLS